MKLGDVRSRESLCELFICRTQRVLLRAHLREEITGKKPSDCENNGEKNKRAYHGIICKTVSTKS